MLNHLKIRISFWYTLLLTFLLAGALFSVYQIVSYQMKTEITSKLENTARSVEAILHDEEQAGEHTEEHHHGEGENQQFLESETVTPFLSIRRHTEMIDDNYLLAVQGNYGLLYQTERFGDTGRELIRGGMPDYQIREVESNGLTFSITSFDYKGLKYFMGYEMSSVAALQRKMMQVFIIVFPIGLLLSVISAFMVTQRSMRVITRIDETTQNISSINLGKRMDVPKGNDEISKLIITLNSMFDRLEKAFSQAKQFSQDAAHELRTPLTIIRGEVEGLMKEHRENPQTYEKLENILEEIIYMSGIAEKLLLIHTMDTGKIKYHFEEVDVSLLLNNICQDAAIISGDKNLTLECDIKAGIILNCNKELITRLAWNLIDNAIKYNIDGGKIQVSLESKTKELVIIVSDSGIGIPQDETERIFDRFYRVDKSRSRGLGGSGLGLAICLWVTELHNGSISVESMVDKGSIFKVSLSSSG